MRYAYARDTPSARDTLTLEIRPCGLEKGLRPSCLTGGGIGL